MCFTAPLSSDNFKLEDETVFQVNLFLFVIQIVKKYPIKQWRSETQSATFGNKISFVYIATYWDNGAMKQTADFCTYYDTIFIAVDKSFLLRYNFFR